MKKSASCSPNIPQTIKPWQMPGLFIETTKGRQVATLQDSCLILLNDTHQLSPFGYLISADKFCQTRF